MVFLQDDEPEPYRPSRKRTTDEWRASGAHRPMNRAWTGMTVFQTGLEAQRAAGGDAASRTVHEDARQDGALSLHQPSEELASRLEAFMIVAKERPEKTVRFEQDSLQRWAATGEVDFLEICAGKGELAMAVSRAGGLTGEGLDRDSYANGEVWRLHV